MAARDSLLGWVGSRAARRRSKKCISQVPRCPGAQVRRSVGFLYTKELRKVPAREAVRLYLISSSHHDDHDGSKLIDSGCRRHSPQAKVRSNK